MNSTRNLDDWIASLLCTIKFSLVKEVKFSLVRVVRDWVPKGLAALNGSLPASSSTDLLYPS